LNKSVFTVHVSWSLTLVKAKIEGQKKFKQKPSLKKYKIEVKIYANPGLAESCFEQPGTGL